MTVVSKQLPGVASSLVPIMQLHLRLFPVYLLATLATAAPKLKDAADYLVKREILEEKYPAFKSFRGVMHAGMMPAGIIDDETDDDEFSSYFFWLLRPRVDATEPEQIADSASAFRNDTLLIWLNGGPGVSGSK